MSHRLCAVVGCNNSIRNLEKWKEGPCDEHGCTVGTGKCDCLPPFRLFPFPSAKRDIESRKMWTKLVNRQDTKSKVWMPNSNSRVCSDHFLDGAPSELHPYPTENLGYQLVTVPKPRKTPSRQYPNVPEKKKRIHNGKENVQHSSSTFTPTFTVDPGRIRPLLESKSNIPYEKPEHKDQPKTMMHDKDTAKLSKDKDTEHSIFTIDHFNNPSNQSLLFHDYFKNYRCDDTGPNTCQSIINENAITPDDNNTKEAHLQQDNSDNLVSKNLFVHNYSKKYETCTQCIKKAAKIKNLAMLINKLRKEITHYKSRIHYSTREKRPFSHRDIDTDQKCKFYTGIPKITTFYDLYDHISLKLPKMRFWRGPSRVSTRVRSFTKSPNKFGPVRKLTGIDEFLLVLIKLRLGLLHRDLAERFDISLGTVSSIVSTWVRFLASELKLLIFNPSKDVVLQHLPKKFSSEAQFRHCRHIIDCTEFFIQTPKDLRIQASTWSDYKHHHTAKYLLSIVPTGAFNFVSCGWGGRTSDCHITRNSGFLDLVEPYDLVLADRGFQIADDLVIRNAYLSIPPGRRGTDQMSKANVKKTKQIANRRIYIEMAIGRLKRFRILKHEIPITLIQHLDDIVTCCVALCNLYPPLCK